MTTDELFSVPPHGRDPLGLAAFKERFKIHTDRAPGDRWRAVLGDHEITAATEIKAVNRVAALNCQPTYEQWKYEQVRRSAQ